MKYKINKNEGTVWIKQELTLEDEKILNEIRWELAPLINEKTKLEFPYNLAMTENIAQIVKHTLIKHNKFKLIKEADDNQHCDCTKCIYFNPNCDGEGHCDCLKGHALTNYCNDYTLKEEVKE